MTLAVKKFMKCKYSFIKCSVQREKSRTRAYNLYAETLKLNAPIIPDYNFLICEKSRERRKISKKSLNNKSV